MPGSAERARALASEHDAGAVVWLSHDGAGGHALWIYDAASDRAAARRLVRPPPYDEPTAAAVGLTVKTLLRHSSVVPEVERYGAEPVRAAMRARHFLVDAHVTGRLRPGGPGPEPRLGLGFRLAPGPLARLGALAASVHVGPGLSVDEPQFAGRFSDLQLSAALAARLALGDRLAIWPRLGGSLHFTDIDGTIPGQAARARAERVNPTADAGIAAELAPSRWPWLRLSLGGMASYALRRQVYLVGGEPVLTIRRVEIEIGAALSVAVL